MSAKSGSHCRAARLVPVLVAAKRLTEYSPDQDGCGAPTDEAAPAGAAPATNQIAINATAGSAFRMGELKHAARPVG
ncbi:hypothetical protein GCM10027068_29080 [Prescottella soli]